MIIWKDFQYTYISSNVSKSDVDREWFSCKFIRRNYRSLGTFQKEIKTLEGKRWKQWERFPRKFERGDFKMNLEF